MLTTQSAKTVKGEALGFLTGVLYLAPATLADATKTVCPWASNGCSEACLFSAGRGQFDNIRQARIAKTKAFWADPKGFVEDLAESIEAVIRKAGRENLIPCIRLNGTSDLPWESLGGQAGVSLMARFPEVQFYDYTKNPNRVRAWLAGRMPANYYLTFSRSETNGETALTLLRAGANVAVVFSTHKDGKLPSKWAGRRVIDGDLHDLRFLDKAGSVVGLRAKGEAKGEESGFVVNV